VLESWQLSQLSLPHDWKWKTVEQSKSGPVYSEKVGASRLWWKRFVEKVSFELGMEQWMCDERWEWWAGGRWIREWHHQQGVLCKAELADRMRQEVDSCRDEVIRITLRYGHSSTERITDCILVLYSTQAYWKTVCVKTYRLTKMSWEVVAQL